MVDKNLVGRCGLFCIYRGYKDGGEYRKGLADFFKVPQEKIRCNGCQVLTAECWGNNCKIVQCQNAKGYRFCIECPEYFTHACKVFEQLYEENLDKGIDLRANLARIKAGGVDAWLKDEDQKFRCPYCRRPIPAQLHSKTCYHCGNKI
jgi:hypothetical protein